MAFQIRGGVWPTMITPFTEDGKIDFPTVQKMVDWYAQKGCNGIFAVCQSSEMLFLTPQEKVDLGKAVMEAADGRMQVIASGHTATDLPTQLQEIESMMKTGVEAYVLVSNALDPKNEGDEVFMKNFEATANAFPEVDFGIYECPMPYKRLVSTNCLSELAQSGKLVFLKDTCCDYELIRERIKAVEGTPLKLFNANAASFYDSFMNGAAGYNGIMANYHPQLYKFVVDNAHNPEKAHEAKLMADLLTEFAMIEMRLYPVSAKYHMNLVGIPMSLLSRSSDRNRLDKNARMEVDSLFALEQYLGKKLGL
ncbi:MAG: dihydrodipicolinate synthase family protein [Candidatus Fimivivens sp.]|nr:dihydrodipicolinate synthase family protein [Candidatus Fimivivens sp.]